tara:strand:- start:248 stop:391 length:144 start_codon:yes stop_codon:yes gene_type:complete
LEIKITAHKEIARSGRNGPVIRKKGSNIVSAEGKTSKKNFSLDVFFI